MSGRGVQLRSLDIRNEHANGVGVFLGSVTDSEFLNINMVADRHWELFPSYQSRRNVFSRIYMTGMRGSSDSDCGRGFGGTDNLITWCEWSHMDRGPTVQSHGAPLSRTLFFECEQSHTGYSQGASEGLLFETGGIISNVISMGDVFVVSLKGIAANQQAKVVQPGNVVCVMDGTKTWARITNSLRHPGTEDQWQIKTDTKLGAMLQESTVYVGSAVTECTIARCKFRDGRAGVTLWGPSLDLHLVDNELRDLDNGFVFLDRSSPTVAFHWDLDQRENARRRVFSMQTIVSKPDQIAVGT